MSERSRRIDAYVGDQMRRRRELMGLSSADLAVTLGVSSEQAERFETGHARIDADTLLALSQILGVSICYFFEGLSERADILAGWEPEGTAIPETPVLAPPPETAARATALDEATELVRAFARIMASPHRREALALLAGLENLLARFGGSQAGAAD